LPSLGRFDTDESRRPFSNEAKVGGAYDGSFDG
jgi:hypothetical protein